MFRETFSIIVHSPSGQTHYHLASPVLFAGNNVENDIVIPDPSFPSVSIRFTANEEGYQASAMDSGIRFSFQGKACAEARLLAGDSVRLGTYELEIAKSNSSADPTSKANYAERLMLEVSRLHQRIAEERDVKRILSASLESLLKILGGTEAFVFTLDINGNPHLFEGTSGTRDKNLFSDSVVQHVLKNRKSLLVKNALSDSDFSMAESVTSLGLRSILCSPILIAEKIHGLFYLGSRNPSFNFDAEGLKTLEIFSTLAGGLIHHTAFIQQQRQVIHSLSLSDGLGIVTANPKMEQAIHEVLLVADTPLNILLTGETGTGKDTLAQLIHRKSRRNDKPFLVVNCGTLRGETLASELFGHKKGAFTGAMQDHRGLFQAAHFGTLFLDEIGDMDLPLQTALLRVLETGKLRPLGGLKEDSVDVRLVCATNRNLGEMVSKGLFREDLYFRINQHQIHLPPLRARGEDILLLAYHFLEKAKENYPQKELSDFHPDSLSKMARYAWPGNIRELANAVNKGALFSRTPLIELVFPTELNAWVDLGEATRSFQLDYVRKAIRLCEGDKEAAAKMLGISRSTLFQKLSEVNEVETRTF